MKRIQKLAIFALIVFLAGCATLVSYRTTRLPAWDTMGIHRLTVLPFEVSDSTSLQRQAAGWLNNTLVSRIRETNHFILVDPAEVTRLQEANVNAATHVDGIIGGRIVSLTVRDSSRTESRIDPKTKLETSFRIYQRDVQLTFNYSLRRARDGIIIGIKDVAENVTDYTETELEIEVDERAKQNRDREADRKMASSIKSPEAIVQEIISKAMRDVNKDLVPYTVVESRSLMKDDSGDKAVKKQSKNAMSLVKTENHKAAQEEFLDIYQNTKSFAAAYNVSLLMMAQRDMNGAQAFMQKVFDETGDQKASAEAARIQRTIQSESAAAAFRDNRNRYDTLITLMTDSVFSRMPRGARAAVVNNSQTEHDLADTIANGIVSGLHSKNITIVDRSNQALLRAERNYQLTGLVNDADIVSLGKEAGVSVFVLVSISGPGSTRYLSVRMLDVGTSTILYQSPQSEEMRL